MNNTNRRKVIIIILFLLTVLIGISAIYIGSRLSEQPTITPEEKKALGEPCNVSTDCSGVGAEYPNTSFCTCNVASGSTCEIRACSNQLCIGGQVGNPPGCCVTVADTCTGSPGDFTCPRQPRPCSDFGANL